MYGHNFGVCQKCGKIHNHPKGMLGKIPWNKGLTKEIDERVRNYGKKISVVNKGNDRLRKFGKNNPMYGKHWKLSEEAKRKLSISKMGDKNPAKRPEVRAKLRNHITEQILERGPLMLGKHHSEEAKLKIKLNHWSKKGYKPWNKGVKQWKYKKHPFLGKHHKTITKEKISKMQKKQWQNPAYREKVIKNVLMGSRKRPTSFENKIIELIEENNLPFKYVGDGKFLICFRNPDFVHNNGKKLLIETYFSLRHPKNYEYFRNKIFTKYGYKTLFLNEKELLSERWREICLEKIKNFVGDDCSS